MRILFLLTQDLESPLGIGRVWPWAKELARRGHRVRIAALHARWNELVEHTFEQEGVVVQYVGPMHVRKVGNQKLYYSMLGLIGISIRATFALTRAALSEPVDIIQVCKPHPMNGLAGILASRLRGIPFCVDCDDLEMANLRFGGSWQKGIVRFFEKIIPRLADHVTAHTSYLREHLFQQGVSPEKFTYLPHGADFARFANVDQTRVEQIRTELALTGKQVVAFIGSLSLRSHPVGLLLEAFNRVHRVCPLAVLLIVGGGEDYEGLVARAQALELGQAVIFRGRVSGSEAPLYCQLANVQVEPVLDNTVGKASLPLKMFESWVSGLPFITANVGDRKSVMGEPPAGLVVQPDHPQALADAIITILSDPELAHTLRARGLTRAEEYSWDILSHRMETIYQQVIKNRNEYQ